MIETRTTEASAAGAAVKDIDVAGNNDGKAVCGKFGNVKDSSAADAVNHPSHYTSGDVECIEAIRAALGDKFGAYCAGNIIKYIWRYEHKGGLQDVRKAENYLGWLAEELELDERAAAEVAEENRIEAEKDHATIAFGAGEKSGSPKTMYGPWVAM